MRLVGLRMLVLAALAGGCGGEDYLVVTIEARPAVHSPMTLAVKVSNGASEVSQSFEVTAATFPASFSVGPGARSTPLTITVEARDAAGLLAGRGTGTIAADADTGTVTLDSADFVVNTDFAGDQVPSNDFEAHGFQVAATGSGQITVVYRDSACAAAGCDIYARRFDSAGRALTSAIAAGTNSFKVSSQLTSSLATPAVAANRDSSIAVWDYDEPGAGTIQGITCRALDAEGRANATEVLVANEVSPDVVSAAAMSNSNFVLAWSAIPGTAREIASVIVRPDCTPIGVVTTISDPAITSTRSSVAANSTGIMFAWLANDSLLVRAYSNALAPTTPIITVAAKTATEKIDHARIVSSGNEFVVFVRWGLITGSAGAGRIDMYRLTAAGALVSGPTLVSSKSGSDFDSRQAFGVASRPDGATMVTWHSCNENGDGEGCGVFGKVYGPGGADAGPEFVVSTTTQGNQSKPSVAGLENGFVAVWSDESGTDPDRAGSSVRARIVYPPTSSGE